MPEKRALGIWKWLMILLVLCNVALIATIWIRPGHRPPPHEPPVNFNERLNFTAEQKTKFDDMGKAHRATIDSLKKLSKEVRERFFAGLPAGEAASAPGLDSLAGVLGTYHKLIELQTYKHFSEVRNMLDSRQKPIFDGLIQEVLTSLPEQPHFKGDGSRRHGPPDGPPGRRGDGHPPPDMEGPPPGPPPPQNP